MKESAQGGDEVHRWDKVYFGELDEVYLLLDFIAGRPDRNVSSLEVELLEEVDDPANPGKKKQEKRTLSAPEIVKRISKLRFPDAPEPQRSEDAAFVLMVKDRLSAFAYPATAQSIAFTYFVTETIAERSRMGALLRWFGWAQSRPASEHLPGHDGTRGSVVRRVFPEFKAMADSFCRFRATTTFCTLLLAMLGALLLAETTYGGQLAARLQAAKKEAAAAAEAIYTAYEGERRAASLAGQPIPASAWDICSRMAGTASKKPDGKATATGDTDSPAAPPPVESAVGKTDGKSPVAGDGASRFIRLCGDYAYSQASFDNAIADMDAYARSLPVNLFLLATPTHKPVTCRSWPKVDEPQKTDEQKLDEKTCGARQEMGPSVSVMVSGFANLVLPLIFGVVGALSATIRRIQDRIVDSILVPRDRSLLWFRVMLGVVAGGSVALFFDPLKVAAEITSGNPTLSVSASGVAFLAGYGAPAFFLLLDKLLARIFDFRDDRLPANGPPPGKAG